MSVSIASSKISKTSTVQRIKKNNSSKVKSHLLYDNVKNYPHRESLVKKSSPIHKTTFSQQLALTASHHHGGIMSARNLTNELVSELSLSHIDNSQFGGVGSSIFGGTSSKLNGSTTMVSINGTKETTLFKTTTVSSHNKRGNLLGPFKFMTEELEEKKLQYYTKGHLETLNKQLSLLEILLATKFQTDRSETETLIMTSWMAVHQKEEEAFTMSMKERTVEEVHNVHHRLVEMVSVH
jgi:hypothetical protein